MLRDAKSPCRSSLNFATSVRSPGWVGVWLHSFPGSLIVNPCFASEYSTEATAAGPAKRSTPRSPAAAARERGAERRTWGFSGRFIGWSIGWSPGPRNLIRTPNPAGGSQPILQRASDPVRRPPPGTLVRHVRSATRPGPRPPRRTPVIEARGLTKRYGALTAVDGVDFDVRPAECVGFLGPNGAGKTTTVRMVTCFTPMTAGTVRVFGLDVTAEPRAR